MIGKPHLNADAPATRLKECRRKVQGGLSKKVGEGTASCKQMQTCVQ
jgi:hypothetical protein